MNKNLIQIFIYWHHWHRLNSAHNFSTRPPDSRDITVYQQMKRSGLSKIGQRAVAHTDNCHLT